MLLYNITATAIGNTHIVSCTPNREEKKFFLFFLFKFIKKAPWLLVPKSFIYRITLNVLIQSEIDKQDLQVYSNSSSCKKRIGVII